GTTGSNESTRRYRPGRSIVLVLSLALWADADLDAPAQIGSPKDPICRLRALPDGAEVPARLEYDVKAALLYRCLEFIEWPSDDSCPKPSTLTIGILGKNRFGESLDFLVGKTISGRKLAVTKVSRSSVHTSPCELIFISASETKRTPKILNNLSGLPV